MTTVAVCPQCANSFVKPRSNVTNCSTRCWQLAQVRTGRGIACGDCGTSLAGTRATYCPDCKAARTRESWRKAGEGKCNDRRRARHHGVEYEKIDRREVYERDGWTCGLCSEPVDRRERWPSPASASLDHVVPISKGGPHVHSNVQLAHLGCNVAKGDREANSAA